MTSSTGTEPQDRKRFYGLALGALGVVYGDLGTSPLYTMKECFAGEHPVALTTANVLGIASLIFWSIILVITIKYVLFVMRADNKGEGGILALMAMARTGASGNKRLVSLISVLGLFGAALFYGDGMITPTISVLSAIEGLEIAAPNLASSVVPLTLVVLIGLFWFQSYGTAKVGALFGPVMIVWFLALAGFGIAEIIDQPGIFRAMNPIWGIEFLFDHGFSAFVALGSVVLALTGAEALYADMGHFGAKPIRMAWFTIVLPALVLNYFGQAALLLNDPSAVNNPFYLLVPSWALYPMIGVSTLATVIASQAVISGAFSLSQQAVQLGYCPRLEVQHTSSEEYGQIYLPRVNWGLLLAIIGLVIGFRSSSALAAAYGIAVTGTMFITTILALIVARRLWNWSLPLCIAIGVAFSIVDGAFFASNLLKFIDGGWFPLVIGGIVFLLMVTWKKGRTLLSKRLQSESIELDLFMARVSDDSPHRVPGTAVFMTGSTDCVPIALLHNMKHNKVLHQRVVFLTVISEPIPRIAHAERVQVESLPKNFFRVIVRYGFNEEPDIPMVMRLCKAKGLEFDMMDTSFFLGRETLIPSVQPEMALWREKLFVTMSRNAVSATDFFKIPANRVVELGTQVQI